jgi:hypothetical protein
MEIDEGELSEYAKNELNKSRNESEEDYTDLDDLIKEIFNLV